MFDLIERLEKATGPDRSLDGDIWEATCADKMYRSLCVRGDDLSVRYYPGPPGPEYHRLPRYTASIDAALMLVPEGYDYGIAHSKQHGLETWVQKPFKGGECFQGYAPEGTTGDATRAIALCIAALRARAGATS